MGYPEELLAAAAGMMDNRVRTLYADPQGVPFIVSDEEEGQEAGSLQDAGLADLVRRSQAGDLRAMEAVYERFKRPVYCLAYRHTLNAASSEDLLQDVFLKVFMHIRSVQEISTFPAWIYRIALNTCYSHLRQKRIRDGKTISLEDLQGPVEETRCEAVESDLRRPLDEAIQSLPNRLRSVFVLHDVQGLKHEEVARTLGCSVGTSKSQLFKARMKIRRILKEKKIL